MSISKREVLKVRVNSIQAAIERARGARTDNVSEALATNFNAILKDTAAAYSDIAEALPEPISLRSMFTDAGLTAARLVDLDAFCDQILGLLSLVDEHGASNDS